MIDDWEIDVRDPQWKNNVQTPRGRKRRELRDAVEASAIVLGPFVLGLIIGATFTAMVLR